MPDFSPLQEKLATLPVRSIMTRVVDDVTSGLVTIVAASTGSGKSMILPSALADASDHRIIVLTPRRFLAIDAAFNVAELAGVKIGDKVGYALGHMDGESSLRTYETKLLYCTYGYALSSGLINDAKTIILDEVHEADEHISLARAILRERKRALPSLRILEMSATVDAIAQARYWQDIAETAIHVIEGAALACEMIHEPLMLAANKGRTAEDIAISLLAQGRKGIVVFRPGVREVENTVAALKTTFLEQKRRDVEVVGIHGGTPADERRLARKAPERGSFKIIVGTNVIESGVNLRWLDAGVSDGFRKIPYYRDDTGATALKLEELPQAGLLQQMGRINRDPAATGFPQGLFILHAKRPFENRRPQNGPAIQRQKVNGIAFHAASLGYDPTRLTWDIQSAAHSEALPLRLQQAKEELMRLELIEDNWQLTEDGAFIKDLPVGPETGAMLCEAKKRDEQRMRETRKAPRVMRDANILAAITESHGLRKDSKQGHKGDQHRTSDLLDGMNAFRSIRKSTIAQNVLAATEVFLASSPETQLGPLQKQRNELEILCTSHNVSLNGFMEVAHLTDEIANRLTRRPGGVRIDERDEDDTYDAARYGELQSCILNANVNSFFLQEHGGLRDLLRDFDNHRNDRGAPFHDYELGKSSIVRPPKDGSFLVGTLREVQTNQPDDQPALLVVTNVSTIPIEVFLMWAANRAKKYQPALTNGKIEGASFSATFAEKARFEITIPASLQNLAREALGGIM